MRLLLHKTSENRAAKLNKLNEINSLKTRIQNIKQHTYLPIKQSKGTEVDAATQDSRGTPTSDLGFAELDPMRL